MAFVTSRIFEGLGRDGVNAMVLLLDLLDHVRGLSDQGMGNVGGEVYQAGETSFRFSEYSSVRNNVFS